MTKTGLTELPNGSPLRRRQTTPDLIADSLRAAIFSGQLADGAELNQAAVAEHYGVSRVPVREAMRALQAEGLITAEAHRRPVVRGLSVDRVLELFDLRQMIEGYLVAQATPVIDAVMLASLRHLMHRMPQAATHDEWMTLNGEFHTRLYAPSGATTALELAESLRGRAERYLRLWSDGRGFDRAESATYEHGLILDRVADGDATGARAEVEAHIAHTRESAARLARRATAHAPA